jgi:pimeloyl-ACP methyl ester carboxylesterase
MHASTLAGIHFLAGRWPFDPQLPLLLFIHGAGGSHLLWLAQLRALAARANTVAIDLPGHGRSAAPGCRQVADYAAAVRGFIAAAGLQRSLVCGLSMGGAIAQSLLLEGAPGLVGGILISTGARLRVLPAIFDLLERDFPAYLDLLGQMLAAPEADPRVIEAAVREAAACPAEITRGDFEACDRFDVVARLPAIAHPVLVIAAEGDRLTPPKYGRLLADKIPGARLALVPQAGHIAPLERPEAVSALIEGFLSELEGGRPAAG